MPWTYNSTRVFPQEMSDSHAQIIPRLQPLASGTILQFFGYENEIKSITAFVVGNTDKSSLESLMTTGLSYELVSPEGSLGDYFPKSITFNRITVMSQTIRPDLDCESPVYRTEFELYKDI